MEGASSDDHARGNEPEVFGRLGQGVWRKEGGRDGGPEEGRAFEKGSGQEEGKEVVELNGYTISSPVIVPVLVAKRLCSRPVRCSTDTYKFGSG